MAITVDDTTVTRWTGTPGDAVDITSASFTPPDSSLLVLGVSADTTNSSTGITVNVSGGSLTWTNRVERDPTEASNAGHASLWTAPVSTGASMTVSVNRGSGGGTNRVSCKVYIVTGQHASPIGANAEGSASTNGSNGFEGNLTATGAGRVFGCGTEWNQLGLPTSTDVEDAADHVNQISLMSAYKSADHSSGTQGINFNASGTQANNAAWNWVVLEILAAGGGPAAAVKDVLGMGILPFARV